MSQSERQSRRHAPRETRREQILDAALECFAAKGYHAATMDDLVLASGLSKGSLYWHFKSKQDVFLGLLERFETELYAAWERAEAEGGGVLDILERQAESTVGWFASQRPLLLAWAEFICHAAARQRMALIYADSRNKLATLLERGIASGEIRDLPAQGLAATLTAGIEGMFLQAMVDPDFPIDAHFPTLWAALRGGLAR